jgi:CRP-like cAMP-binding protein
MTPNYGRSAKPGGVPAFGAYFADIPAEELDELAAAMSEIEVAVGTEVVTVDTYASGMFLIVEGEAEVLAGDAMPTSQVLGPGDVFGEIALLLTEQRVATVVARTQMRLRTLSDPEFRLIRERVPRFEGLLRSLAVDRAGS